jgi:glutamine amidotransferase-like uncharacterized protein
MENLMKVNISAVTLILVILGTAILGSTEAFAREKPLALVWKNGGTCFPYCARSAANMALKAGFKVRYITKYTKHLKEALEEASVWIQPGGKSKLAAKRMGSKTMDAVRKFVRGGGGYVGFCAGMLLATKKIGDSDIDGLGILNGKTVHLMSKALDKAYIVNIDTVEHGPRSIYFSGGPFLVDQDDDTYISAFYGSGEIAAVESNFGKGRVIVSGYHPEVPTWFKKLTRMFDPDGNDYDIAIEMIKRSGRLEEGRY